MKLGKLTLILASGFILLVLGACNGSNPPAPSSTASVESTAHAPVSQGGQVVETGDYHLELVTLKEETGTHLDFYLQDKSNHETIPNAKVTGQIQLLEGTEQKLEFTYDPEGKHYTALLPEKASGNYQVKINADVEGKSVSGRFSFNSQ